MEMFSVGNLIFEIEILAAELLFLYSSPKRGKFPLRLIATAAVCLLLAYFFPMPQGELRFNVFYSLLRFMLLFAYTIAGMLVCFKLKPFIIISFCTGGYAVQHIGYHVLTILLNACGARNLGDIEYLIEVAVFACVYVVLWLMFGRYAAKHEYYKNYDKKLNVISIIIVLLCIVLTRLVRYETKNFTLYSVSIYSIACCWLALVVQFSIYRYVALVTENNVIKYLRETDKRQYEITKNTIETINIKCHDLKHKIYALDNKLSEEEISEIKESVRMYDNSLKTGNSVLDVVLMDNSLRYGAEGVTFSFMGNGEFLSFIGEADLASLLGNALGNAVEAVIGVEEKEKRNIGIVLEKKGDMVTLVIQNYFNGNITISEGLPETTKKDSPGDHGFGLKSIQRTAKKYGGDIRISINKDIFVLSVYVLAA